jgi:hypothetical protein
MSVFQAARQIRDDNPDIDWSTALYWAWFCLRQADEQKAARKEMERQAFFLQFKINLPAKKFVQKLHSAKAMPDHGTHDAVSRWGETPAAYKAEARPDYSDEPLYKMTG